MDRVKVVELRKDYMDTSIAYPSTKSWTGASTPWPALAVGDKLEIEYCHWIYPVEVLEVHPDGSPKVKLGERWALPVPPVELGRPYVLPNISGDAWLRGWAQGDIVRIYGQYYKVAKKPKYVSAECAYDLTLALEEEWLKRPGRVVLPNDRNPQKYVGSVHEIQGEFLLVKKVVSRAYGSAEGEVFGHTLIGKGNFIPAAKAVKAKAKWDALEKVRSLELSLRVAQQDLDYGGNPEIVPKLKVELAAAKKAAGIKE